MRVWAACFLQLAGQMFQVGLRGGVLLLQDGGLLFQARVFLFRPGQRLLLAAGRAAGDIKLLLQLLAALLLVRQRLFHEFHQVPARLHDGIGRHVHPGRTLRVVAGDPTEVRRKRQQAQQQKVANDDENAAVHASKAGSGAAAGAAGRAAAAISASINSFRRAGRRWKILKMTTKMMPKQVEE